MSVSTIRRWRAGAPGSAAGDGWGASSDSRHTSPARARRSAAAIAELGAHAGHVHQRPDLGELTVLDAVHGEVDDADAPARGGQAQELAAVGAFQEQARG